MNTAVLETKSLEFVPTRIYAATHGCGATIVGEGAEMRQAIISHTTECEWTEPTA